ncbi:uncharacterized protein LOC129304617 [Prosopis cineraria]|uniref:uncharacterized protein LOC129304617 n=1 Tax=Prosopis cineraria TaxID=364024 RepID=UPI00240FCC3C|nr:uncharacterized protein LOC129304617 [Prosopis cineraria]
MTNLYSVLFSVSFNCSSYTLGMIMEKKGFFRLLVFLLGLFYLVLAVAVPATRISKARGIDSPVPHLTKRTEVEFEEEGNGGDEGRMMMTMIDYAGAKANPAHDPKSPGKP